MPKVLFIMEQHIGHYAFYQNLRNVVDQSDRIKPTWQAITYRESSSIWQRLRFLPATLSGPLVGRSQVRKGLRSIPYDVAVFNTQVPAVLGYPLSAQRPYILCTDVTPIQYDSLAFHYNHHPDRGDLISSFKHRANFVVFQRAERIISWSHWTAESLNLDYGVEKDRIEVIAPGVDCNYFKPTEKTENNPVRILFVGGDFYRKGGTELLKAFSTIPPGKAELILVTRTQLPPQPGVKVIDHITPNSSELLTLYQTSDIFVLPSLAETFGIAAVEASAAGLPIIAASMAGLKDIVADGQTGILVPPGDVHALASSMTYLISDPVARSTYGSAARRRALQLFNSQTNANRIIDVVLEICAQQPHLALNKP